MKLMDEKKLGFTTAVELSYIGKKNQNYIAVAIDVYKRQISDSLITATVAGRYRIMLKKPRSPWWMMKGIAKEPAGE